LDLGSSGEGAKVRGRERRGSGRVERRVRVLMADFQLKGE
jgi:hypothetical protein